MKSTRYRVEPTCYEVYDRKKLIGWVDINCYSRSPKCEWTAAGVVDASGRSTTLDKAVEALRSVAETEAAP
jgi:hypothetical protein